MVSSRSVAAKASASGFQSNAASSGAEAEGAWVRATTPADAPTSPAFGG